MKKLFLLMVSGLFALAIVACTPTETDELKVNFVAETRGIGYAMDTPLIMPDGRSIIKGELTPFWSYLSDHLEINLKDNMTHTTSREMLDAEALTGFKNSHIYGGNNTAEKFMELGPENVFVNLNDHLGQLPNVSEFLEENPTIASAITAHDGGIYHLPYIAEIGNYARAFMGRQTWVTLLLDSNIDDLLAETATLDVAYDNFWRDQRPGVTTNVIELQNATLEAEKLTFLGALGALRQYITATYQLENLSELYLGVNAQYDIDELVALWRVIRLAPNNLSAQAVGGENPQPVEGAIIAPFVPRQTSYREDLMRLATYMAGQRVFGSDSYGAKFYLDQDGVLQHSYSNNNLLTNILPRLQGMVAEGLVVDGFEVTAPSATFRPAYFGNDTAPNHKQFGFMTFDFIPSTTSLPGQDDVEGILPPLTTTPVTGDEWIHWVENTRVIKPDGWAIAAHTSGDRLVEALKLFDYFFSQEGHDATNFGWPEIIDGTINIDGTEFPKFTQWVLDEAAARQNGDAAQFQRRWLGLNFPLGYVKSIGMERQFLTERGRNTEQLYIAANVHQKSYAGTAPDGVTVNSYFQLVPPVFALTAQEVARIKDAAGLIGETQTELIFQYITGKADVTVQTIINSFESSGIAVYIQQYRNAYARMTGSNT